MTDRDRLIELLQEYTDDNNGGGSNHGLADYLLANGVIVLPCELRQNVYHIVDNVIQEMFVSYATVVKGGITMTAKCLDESEWCDAGCKLQGKTCGIGFDYKHIGKTVFLTKEEAEAKLKELGKE